MNYNFISDLEPNSKYDVVVVGSGFGSLFYLHGVLEHSPSHIRVLVIERGDYLSHPDQIDLGSNSKLLAERTAVFPKGNKPWNFTIGLGGGTNCWWGQAPRMVPQDFRLASLYGVGWDWPVEYEDLEPFYCHAEEIMAVSGDSHHPLFPRSKPYPLPPHIPSTPDKIMLRSRPSSHLIMPTARASVPTEFRSACCSMARCNLCPMDAKFTAFNGMNSVLSDPRIDILINAEVKALDTSAGVVSSAVIDNGSAIMEAHGDYFVLGANAIFNPTILKRSGDNHHWLGHGINEQYGYSVEALLAGVDNFDGSTVTTGLNYELYDGSHRQHSGAAMVYFENRWNNTGLRMEPMRWRQTLPLVVNVEDLPQHKNRVECPTDWDRLPTVHHEDVSQYAHKGMKRALNLLPEVLSPLPVEKILLHGPRETESHLQGTTRMGTDPETSVVDGNLIHHKLRNLAVVGTSVFPSCPPANPSLTAAALSLRASKLTFQSGGSKQ